MVKHQRNFVVLKTTSNVKGLFKSATAPLYRSLVTSLSTYNIHVILLPTLYNVVHAYATSLKLATLVAVYVHVHA